MSTQEHIQKQSQTQSNVEIPELAVQSKTTATASQPTPPSGNLKTRLSRATRFGHNLTKISALQTKAATGQANLTIQRQAQKNPEQIKSQRSVQLPIQRQAAPAKSPSPSNAMAGMDAYSFYSMMNHQVESILPQIQAKMMQQPISAEVIQEMEGEPVQMKGGGKKGGKK